MKIEEEYLQLLRLYKKKYGEKTSLFYQVGGFYEFYGKEESEMDYLKDLLQFKITKRSGQQEFFMSGFPIDNYDKHLKTLLYHNYVCILYDQVDIINEKKKDRVLKQIYSPGCYIEQETLTSYISCIWIEIIRNNSIVYGMSTIDTYTGNSNIEQVEELYNINNTIPVEPIEKFIDTYRPKEILFLHNTSEKNMSLLTQSLQTNSRILLIDMKENDTYKVALKNCNNIIYLTKYLCEHLGNEFINKNKQSFEDFLTSYQSLSFLLYYINIYNEKLISNIKEPKQKSQKLYLGNHSLKQLNIIGNTTKSVLNKLNECKTTIGKRFFEQKLLNPIYDTTLLNEQYNIIELFLSQSFDFTSELKKMYDIEKIRRKIELETYSFDSIIQLYQTCNCLLYHLELIKNDKWLDYIKNEYVNENIHTILDILNQFVVSIHEEQTENYMIYKKNILTSFDICRDKYYEHQQKIEMVLKTLNQLYQEEIDKKSTTIFTLKNNQICATTKRCESFLKKIKHKKITIQYVSNYNHNTIEFIIDTKDFITTPSSQKGQNKISFSLLDSIFLELPSLESQLKKEYQDFISIFLKKLKVDFTPMVECIQKIDYINTVSLLSKKYNLCKPIIEENEVSFLKCKEMRHLLIELLDQEEPYVSNDLSLENKQEQGILLYGINAVGKSSLIKAIGIIIVMAQSGMYVPCSSFIFSPYKSIYTRIVSNDNIYKGLSTFNLEICELNQIIKNCDSNTLVLGDELCSGTEYESALSICIGTLETLYNNKSTFILATHLHQLYECQEIIDLPHLKIKHLDVNFDDKLDKIIYNRKLREGPGSSFYGLEVCKSLKLGSDQFMKRLYEINKKYNKNVSLLESTTSKYNSKIIKYKCERCNKPLHKNESLDTHHIKHQKNSTNGYVEQTPIHNQCNLMNLCSICHELVHKNNESYEKRKTIDGTIFYK